MSDLELEHQSTLEKNQEFSDDELVIEDDESENIIDDSSQSMSLSEDHQNSLVCKWENCQGCSFDNPTKFSDHIIEDHIKNRKGDYSCMWFDCSRKGIPLATRFALISHTRKHTGEKPFTCPVDDCKLAFSRSDTLYKHIKSNHPDYQSSNSLEQNDENLQVSSSGKRKKSQNIPQKTVQNKKPIYTVEDLLNDQSRSIEEKIEILRLFQEHLVEDNKSLEIILQRLEKKSALFKEEVFNFKYFKVK